VFTARGLKRVRGGWLCINSQPPWLRQDANSKQKKASTARRALPHPVFSQRRQGPQVRGRTAESFPAGMFSAKPAFQRAFDRVSRPIIFLPISPTSVGNAQLGRIAPRQNHPQLIRKGATSHEAVFFGRAFFSSPHWLASFLPVSSAWLRPGGWASAWIYDSVAQSATQQSSAVMDRLTTVDLMAREQVEAAMRVLEDAGRPKGVALPQGPNQAGRQACSQFDIRLGVAGDEPSALWTA